MLNRQIQLLEYRITDLRNLENLNQLKQFSGEDSNIQIITLNIEHLRIAKLNQEFHGLLSSVELLVPDGESIILLASLGSSRRDEEGTSKLAIKKYAGIDLCEDLIKIKQRICFLGAGESVSKSLEEKFTRKFTEKDLYFQHGYYDIEDEAEIMNRISAFKPDLLIVALGAPRQDFLINKYRQLFTNCIFIGVGGALDIFAAKLKRAPKILIKLKLEWLYRILQEPSRFLKLIPNFIYFIKLIFKLGLNKSSYSLSER